jgi:hypothetical protein
MSNKIFFFLYPFRAFSLSDRTKVTFSEKLFNLAFSVARSIAGWDESTLGPNLVVLLEVGVEGEGEGRARGKGRKGEGRDEKGREGKGGEGGTQQQRQPHSGQQIGTNSPRNNTSRVL